MRVNRTPPRLSLRPAPSSVSIIPQHRAYHFERKKRLLKKGCGIARYLRKEIMSYVGWRCVWLVRDVRKQRVLVPAAVVGKHEPNKGGKTRGQGYPTISIETLHTNLRRICTAKLTCRFSREKRVEGLDGARATNRRPATRLTAVDSTDIGTRIC
jgi:hypothetical protein